ncbi:uncharacterized protein B0T15DRAFT_516774 [Chaetomium strumarium]|uniref:Secreted protein n=1 Tax=Chaetomium strumarium TaxID=1170767 RepID=A0AAJ0H131_9PEZI|nr:hypothetical protein B0T15DRAFT_516774 [Chaetomium strumarium]
MSIPLLIHLLLPIRLVRPGLQRDGPRVTRLRLQRWHQIVVSDGRRAAACHPRGESAQGQPDLLLARRLDHVALWPLTPDGDHPPGWPSFRRTAWRERRS